MHWDNSIATHLQWSGEISNRQSKEAVAVKLADLVRHGDVIGIGSGSTAFLALQGETHAPVLAAQIHTG